MHIPILLLVYPGIVMHKFRVSQRQMTEPLLQVPIKSVRVIAVLVELFEENLNGDINNVVPEHRSVVKPQLKSVGNSQTVNDRMSWSY